MDQPVVERLAWGQGPSLEHHLHRSADADESRQSLGAAGAWVEVDGHLRKADRDVPLSHQSDVAGQRDLTAAAGGRAVDRRYEDLFGAVHLQEQVVNPVEL